MEKLIEKEVTKKIVYREYYCDHCNKFLTKIEDNDMCYMASYRFKASIGANVEVRKVLCKECADKFTQDIKELYKILNDYGFREIVVTGLSNYVFCNKNDISYELEPDITYDEKLF